VTPLSHIIGVAPELASTAQKFKSFQIVKALNIFGTPCSQWSHNVPKLLIGVLGLNAKRYIKSSKALIVRCGSSGNFDNGRALIATNHFHDLNINM
jgi:hypothetical protein